MSSYKIHSITDGQAILRKQAATAEVGEEGGTKSTLSLATRNKLFQQLDATQRSMEKLQSRADDVSKFASIKIEYDLQQLLKNYPELLENLPKDLPEKFTKLYGRIHNLAVDNEVKKVEKEAKQLEVKLENGNTKAVAKEVGKLKRHIHEINEQHALGREHLSTVAMARNVANRADHFLHTHTLGQGAPRPINQFNLLEVQRYQYREEGVDSEMVIELFGVAEAFFFGLEREAMKRFHQLPQEAKRQCNKHFVKLEISSPLEDRIKTAQALIATAYDLTNGEGKEPYLSVEELQRFFQEAASETT